MTTTSDIREGRVLNTRAPNGHLQWYLKDESGVSITLNQHRINAPYRIDPNGEKDWAIKGEFKKRTEAL